MLSESPCAQMHKIILMVDETGDSVGKEKWYTNQYVASQLEKLRRGKHALLSFSYQVDL
jgi:hypothetical protein